MFMDLCLRADIKDKAGFDAARLAQSMVTANLI